MPAHRARRALLSLRPHLSLPPPASSRPHLPLPSPASLRPRRSLLRLLVAIATLVGAAFAGTNANVTSAAGLDPYLAQAFQQQKEQDFFVVLGSRADTVGAASKAAPGDRTARVAAVRKALREHAAATQAPLVRMLEARGVRYRSFHIVNALLVHGDRKLAEELLARPDVLRLDPDPAIRVPLPRPEDQPRASRKLAQAIAAVEPGIVATEAPSLWAQGILGQGIVVGGQDTGVAWNHPALIAQYRGTNGAAIAHDYNWHDSIHSEIGTHTTPNPCGYDSPFPCDDNDQGTHTVGTAVGGDGGANQIGMAPGARWIACRNMDRGTGKPSTYLECFEWFLAPYPVGGTPAQGDPSRAPHVTVNSWGCPPSEGCSALILKDAVEAQRAAGIMTVVAAGNGGSACNTVDDPPAIYDAAYSIAAYSAASDTLASFSSRGPVTVDGSGRMKPDLAAPGGGVRSAVPGGYATFSGTSMATPHVVGAVALLWSAIPALKGDVAATENALNASAVPVPLADAQCGTVGSPNALWGFGKLDVAAALTLASPLVVSKRGSGSGSVASVPTGIACGAACSASFGASMQVSLTATPDGSSVFTGWQCACTGLGPCVLATGAGRRISATFASPASMPLSVDVDGNGRADALTDGLLIVRYLFGVDPGAMAAGAIGADATVPDASQLAARISDLLPLFDVDGNGRTDALTDGVLVIRYLFGLRGLPLVAGALGAGATRTEPAAVEAYIASLLPQGP
jgi:subtilisin family serine protease